MRLRALLESDPDYFEVIRGALPGPTEAEGQLGDLPEWEEMRRQRPL